MDQKEEIQNYIRRQLMQNKTEDEIREHLLSMGWEAAEVEENLSSIKEKRRLRKKRFAVFSIVSIVVIAAIILIVFFAPRSPIREQAQTRQYTVQSVGLGSGPQQAPEELAFSEEQPPKLDPELVKMINESVYNDTRIPDDEKEEFVQNIINR